MGWKGTIRTIGAIHRANQRENQRQARAQEKYNKAIEKIQNNIEASRQVMMYEHHIDTLKSIHKEYGELIDWKAISKLKKPSEPIMKNTNENKFKVGFFTKVFGNEEKQKKKAIEKDEEKYKILHNKWIKDCKEWKNDKLIADKLLSGDEDTKLDIIKKVNPFSDIKELGSSIIFKIEENNILEGVLNLQGKDIVPTEKKILLQSGKLSIKKIPKGEFNELYQDYICSSILRVGNELLAILPDDIVLVHAMDYILNTKTGHMENQCIASVAISRDTIASLNMDLIDPSDSFENFVHNMTFKKTKGFEIVKLLSPLDFSSNRIS